MTDATRRTAVSDLTFREFQAMNRRRCEGGFGHDVAWDNEYALEARLAEYRKTATNMRELHDQLDDENEALQARLDAATELIRNMIAQDDRVHEVWDGLDEGPCPETAPFRAWLAGDKEATDA